ncbi:hypothetical protein BJF78_28555 [Pseudonocardia sp. CNS-139]|nr:hypothetical protein BJF78_28555 [Pseudonocardia sp. CNS-139]
MSDATALPAGGGGAVPLSRAAAACLSLLRIALGWVMLWAGLDRMFGLGMATPPERSVLSGASATAGYLGGVSGPAAPLFTAMAGNPVVDTLFVAGMLLCGLALVLGVTTLIAGLGAAVIFGMLWLTMIPLENNPVVDQHLFYALAGVLVAVSNPGRFLGIGAWWSRLPVVRSSRWLW